MEPLARHRCDVSATQLPFFPAESLALSDALMPRNFIELVTELLQRSSQLCFWALWVEGAAKAQQELGKPSWAMWNPTPAHITGEDLQYRGNELFTKANPVGGDRPAGLNRARPAADDATAAHHFLRRQSAHIFCLPLRSPLV